MEESKILVSSASYNARPQVFTRKAKVWKYFKSASSHTLKGCLTVACVPLYVFGAIGKIVISVANAPTPASRRLTWEETMEDALEQNNSRLTTENNGTPEWFMHGSLAGEVYHAENGLYYCKNNDSTVDVWNGQKDSWISTTTLN